MNDFSAIDGFLSTFITYIDSGFGLISGDVTSLAAILIVIDVTLAALFWAWGQNDIIQSLVKKTLYVGAFAFIFGNFAMLSTIVFDSFATLGLDASAASFSPADLLKPGLVAAEGLSASQPIFDHIGTIAPGPFEFFGNLAEVILLCLGGIIVIAAFFVLSIQLFVLIVEFKITTLAGFVLVPFAFWKQTTFLAERVLGNVISSGIKVLVIAVVIGIGSSRKPAEVKPMMSDPARPEVAQGAVRSLPSDYTQAAARQSDMQPALPPQLGPPLPGDVAAFASPPPTPPDFRSYSDDWSTPAAYVPPEAADPALAEAVAAERSGIFFALREEPRKADTATQSPVAFQKPSNSPLTAVAARDDAQPAGAIRSDRVLFPGAVIPASLVTELNSESPGPVIAQVTQTIYDSATGRVALIPQGARLIGEYKSSARYGQSRVAIIWSRLIMPNGDEHALDEAATDPSGAAGVKGEVDNHWGDVFGAAALGTLINVGVATTEEPQLTYGGIGAITRDPVDAAIADGVQRTASSVTNRVVDRGLSIPPTIRVQAGQRVSVIVTRRIAL